MYYSATPGYFEALRIPLKAGRYFTKMDAERAAHGHHQRIYGEEVLRQRESSGTAPAVGGSVESRPRSSALWATYAMRSSNRKGAWPSINPNRNRY